MSPVMLSIMWIVIAVALLIFEGLTVQLVAIWLALAALFSVIPAALGQPLYVQLLVFAVVSTLCLIITRPLVKKVLKFKTVHTNADDLIGRTAVVIIDIDPIQNTGRVLANGLDWWAITREGEAIDKGETVLIKAIEGAKLVVERI